ncbi:dihydrofolate reductase [Escherichia phage ECD7]|uniref:dihydrofolate reductase n=1 Tax=Escherichia phage ECD7 TaxID=1981499 RepID=A0A220NTR0_9CAUD|nr:dihydrofolate reductase [Escherichia phage ECD7]ASJ80324.1 dihydrofolate reductase [Escherichia phage ECD7]
MIQCVFAIGNTKMSDENWAFGFKGGLPWDRPIKKDMENFKIRTIGDVDFAAVVMGRNTFESLPKALWGRLNVVVSTDTSKPEPKTKNGDQPDVYTAITNDDELKDLLKVLEKTQGLVSVIGGPSLIEKAVDFADRIVLTYVQRSGVNDPFEYDVGISKEMIQELYFDFATKEEHNYFLDNYLISEQILERKKA